MPFFYLTGQEIRKGDRVRLHDEPGEIEAVADSLLFSDERQVADKTGVMVVEPRVFGRLFLTDPRSYEDLIFVSREENFAE